MNEIKVVSKQPSSEKGQVLVFAAITAFPVICAIFLAVHTGSATRDRVRMQNATDAASYSGALIQANSLNAITWLNQQMAQTYSSMADRYAETYRISAATILTGLSLFSINRALGYVFTLYVLYRLLRQDIGHIEEIDIPDLERFSRMEREIISVTPQLVEEEVKRISFANGVDALTLLTYRSTEVFQMAAAPATSAAPPDDQGSQSLIARILRRVRDIMRQLEDYICNNLLRRLEDFKVKCWHYRSTKNGGYWWFHWVYPFREIARSLRNFLQGHIRRADPESLPRPMVLNENFFSQSIFTGVGLDGKTAPSPLLSQRAMASLAVSWARPAFLNQNQTLRTRFDTELEMQDWLSSDANMLTSVWSAKLVSGDEVTGVERTTQWMTEHLGTTRWVTRKGDSSAFESIFSNEQR